MRREAEIYWKDQQAGTLREDDAGYHFVYREAYRRAPGASPVSLTLPLERREYSSAVLFPFFDGLIPEGWLLDRTVKSWKINPRDRMGLLLVSCRDCIGAVSVIPRDPSAEENRP